MKTGKYTTILPEIRKNSNKYFGNNNTKHGRNNGDPVADPEDLRKSGRKSGSATGEGTTGSSAEGGTPGTCPKCVQNAFRTRGGDPVKDLPGVIEKRLQDPFIINLGILKTDPKWKE